MSEKYPKDVKLAVKHFPLAMHAYARKAAIAALAAGKQGKFWEMHEKIFQNQKGLSDSKIEMIAQELGLDPERFSQDLKDPSLGSAVDKDLSDGMRANVQGTPTIFINGKIFTQRNLEGFQQAIEGELGKVQSHGARSSH